MSEDLIRYDILAQAALRGVVRTVLADAAQKGLPGDHHFKITFATGAPGVRLSDRIRAQYPQTMTIILQHQFWDLAVREDAFDVGLSFGGVAEKLTVPFEAVTAFVDPSVQFGFQFQSIEGEPASEAESAPRTVEEPGLHLVEKPHAPSPAAESKKPDTLPPAAAMQQGSSEKGGEVVSLDRFRKK